MLVLKTADGIFLVERSTYTVTMWWLVSLLNYVIINHLQKQDKKEVEHKKANGILPSASNSATQRQVSNYACEITLQNVNSMA